MKQLTNQPTFQPSNQTTFLFCWVGVKGGGHFELMEYMYKFVV